MKRRCLLLADSHHNVLGGLIDLLGDRFESVVMVADGASLLATVGKVEPDLAVVDLSLPVFSEVNIARRLTGRYPELKFIILSLHDEPTVVEEILSAGAAGFVLKRRAGADLGPAVEAVLRGETYISPEATASAGKGEEADA
jgi:DNA-binding NarL/FixJ family response regulator